MEKEINQIWFFKHSPETVWDYLTRSELLAQWLMENDIQPTVGHQFMFRSKPAPAIAFDGNVYCQVLEVLPGRKLSYSWKFGPEPGKITVDSVVTWTLVPKDHGTELKLEHKGFKGADNLPAWEAMNMGWKKNVEERLGQLLIKNETHEINR